MRIWSLHPKYLDARGLVALWREALLAQKVLQGETRGYRHHPQLDRFKAQPDPVAAVGAYLLHVWKEADRRGYQFDRSKIAAPPSRRKMPVTTGQLAYEWDHLQAKLRNRDPVKFRANQRAPDLLAHPLFEPTEGEVEPWEVRPGRGRAKNAGRTS